MVSGMGRLFEDTDAKSTASMKSENEKRLEVAMENARQIKADATRGKGREKQRRLKRRRRRCPSQRAGLSQSSLPRQKRDGA